MNEPPFDSLQISLTIIISVLLLVVMVGMVVLLLVGSHNRRNRYRAEMAELRARHAEEVRAVEREVLNRSLTEVASELHDNIGQKVMTARLMMQPLRDVPQSREQADKVLQQLALLADEVRGVSRALNRDAIGERPLDVWIGAECDRLSELGKWRVTWHAPSEPIRPAPDHALILFRLFQESVHNAMKHAEATTIDVRLSGTPSLELEIRDNGKGFDPAQVSGGGQGLRNMKRRAELIGYHCDVISAPGTGCTIRIGP